MLRPLYYYRGDKDWAYSEACNGEGYFLGANVLAFPVTSPHRFMPACREFFLDENRNHLKNPLWIQWDSGEVVGREIHLGVK